MCTILERLTPASRAGGSCLYSLGCREGVFSETQPSVSGKPNSRKLGCLEEAFSKTQPSVSPLLYSSAGPHHCQLSQPLASLEEQGADDETPLVLIAATIDPTSRPKKMRLTSSFTRIPPTLLTKVRDTFTYPCHALQDQAR